MSFTLPRPPETDDERVAHTLQRWSMHTSGMSKPLLAEDLKTHRMVSKDIETMTGVCRKCGPVRLCKNGVYYKCWSQSRELLPEELERHRMVSRDIATMTGVCRKCGPVSLFKYKTDYYVCGAQTMTDKRATALRNAHLQRRYGLTPKQFKQLVAENGPTCRICRRIPDIFHVDHNHTTGVVRGVLCGDCNRGLGIFHDSVEALAAAIVYLEAA